MLAIVFFVKRNWLIFAIAFALFLIKVPLLSSWLEDWDSVQFALALRNYSIIEHTPHPPGYPVYIFINKIINLIFNNEALTLSLFSSISGSVIVIPFYFLARKIIYGQKKKSRPLLILTCLLLVSFPVTLNLSLVGLTNIPGTTFTVISALFLYLGRKNTKYLYLGSFLSGLTLGVRFAEYSILITLIILITIVRKFKGFILSSFLFSLGVIIWLTPLIYDTGLDNFIKSYSTHGGYIATHDSLNAFESLSQRLKPIWYLITLGYTNYVIFLIFLVGMGALLLYKKFLRFNYLFVVSWMLSYFIPLLFVYNLEVPRHVLPLAPPFVLLLGLVTNDLKYGIGFKIFLAFLTPFILFTALNYAYEFKNIVPPTIQPVLFVKTNFTPTNTTLITSFTFRQFQYYLPNYKNYWGTTLVPKSIDTEFIVIDYPEFRNFLPYLKDYNEVQRKNFSEDKKLFPRIPSTNLYIFKKAKSS